MSTFGIFSQVSVVLVVLDVIMNILATIEDLLRRKESAGRLKMTESDDKLERSTITSIQRSCKRYRRILVLKFSGKKPPQKCAVTVAKKAEKMKYCLCVCVCVSKCGRACVCVSVGVNV